MRTTYTNLLILSLLILVSCHSKKMISPSPSTKFEGDYSLIINEVISYGKEYMPYAFQGCTQIKSTAHLDEDYYCQFKIWTENWDEFSEQEKVIPDSNFLFNPTNRELDLNLDESMINHCIQVIEGKATDQFLTSSLPQNSLMFSPIIPTNSPDFYLLWVHIVRDRDPPEMSFTLLKEGDIFKVIAGSWDDQCF